MGIMRRVRGLKGEGCDLGWMVVLFKRYDYVACMQVGVLTLHDTRQETDRKH